MFFEGRTLLYLYPAAHIMWPAYSRILLIRSCFIQQTPAIRQRANWLSDGPGIFMLSQKYVDYLSHS